MVAGTCLDGVGPVLALCILFIFIYIYIYDSPGWWEGRGGVYDCLIDPCMELLKGREINWISNPKHHAVVTETGSPGILETSLGL